MSSSNLEKSVHIRNLPFTVTQDDLQDFLEKQANAEGIKIISMPNHRGSRNNKGFCNVELPSEEQANQFIECFKDISLEERDLHAEKMKPRDETTSEHHNRPKRTFERKSANHQSRPKFTLYISGVNFKTTKSDWIKYFRSGGEVTQGFFIEKFPMDSDRNKGFFFVSFPTQEQCDTVINDMDDEKIFGRRIRVSMSKTQESVYMSKKTPTRDNNDESEDNEEKASTESKTEDETAPEGVTDGE